MPDLLFSQPLYQQLYKSLKNSILIGEYEPGSKLIVSKLAEEYNISRTPMREALRQLQSEGLIVQRQNNVHVVELSEEDFRDLYECRAVLEIAIMKAISKTINQDLLLKLNGLLKDAEQSLEERDYLKLLDLNTQFHDSLLEASSNKRAVQLVHQVRSFLLIYRAKILRNYEFNKEILREHNLIYESLKEGDEEEVIRCVEQHLNNDIKRGEKLIS